MVAIREQECTICRIAGFTDDYTAEMGPIYEDVPMPQPPKHPEPRDWRNIAVPIVCLTALAAAFAFVGIVGQVRP